MDSQITITHATEEYGMVRIRITDATMDDSVYATIFDCGGGEDDVPVPVKTVSFTPQEMFEYINQKGE